MKSNVHKFSETTDGYAFLESIGLTRINGGRGRASMEEEKCLHERKGKENNGKLRRKMKGVAAVVEVLCEATRRETTRAQEESYVNLN